MAIENKNIEIVKILMQNKNIDVNVKYILSKNGEKTPLHMAIEEESIEIAKLLIQNKNIDINTICITEDEKKTALHMAVQKESIDIVKLLLQNESIDINAKCIYNHKEFDSRYTYDSFDPYSRDEYVYETNTLEEKTALHIAVYKKKNIEITSLLIQDKRININIIYKCQISTKGDIYSSKMTEENKSKTVLDIAIERGIGEIVRNLIQKKIESP